MGIGKKIDEIRQKPEHIRLRWAWILSVTFTAVIIFFWVLSIKIHSKKASSLNDQASFMNEFQQQKKSMKDAVNGMEKTFQNLPKANNEDFSNQTSNPDEQDFNNNNTTTVKPNSAKDSSNSAVNSTDSDQKTLNSNQIPNKDSSENLNSN